jgi:hypothetical protein
MDLLIVPKKDNFLFNKNVHFKFSAALFDSHEPTTESEFASRKEEALRNFQNFLRPILQLVTGPQKFEEGTKLVFDALQVRILT